MPCKPPWRNAPRLDLASAVAFVPCLRRKRGSHHAKCNRARTGARSGGARRARGVRFQLRGALQAAGPAPRRRGDGHERRGFCRLSVSPDRSRDREVGQRFVPRQPAQGQPDRERCRDGAFRDQATRHANGCGGAAARRPSECASDGHGLALGAAVGHAADPHTGSACDHGRQPRGAGGRHRYGNRFPPSGPEAEHRRGQQRQLRERSAGARTCGTGRQRPRHPYRRNHRRRRQRIRNRRRGAERQDRRNQGGQHRRLLLSRSGDLRVRLGSDAPRRRDEQQLLRRSVSLQLPQRPGPARHLEGGAAGNPVRAVEGSHGGRRDGERERGSRAPDCRRDQPG